MKIYAMNIVTNEYRLDELLTIIFNTIPDAQKPLHQTLWKICADKIPTRRLNLESVWGGRLISVGWQTTDQHVLPYTGSADGLETWVDITLGRKKWRAERLHESIATAAEGLAYRCSRLRDVREA